MGNSGTKGKSGNESPHKFVNQHHHRLSTDKHIRSMANRHEHILRP